MTHGRGARREHGARAQAPEGTRDAEGARGLVAQRREWLAQRIGRVALLVFVGVAASGLIGGERGLTVVRAAAIYLALMLFVRISGKRTVGELTPFDFVLLLVISEASGQTIVGDDYSLTTALVAVATLVVLDIGLAYLTFRSRLAADVLDGGPLVIVADGEPLLERLERERITIADVMMAARVSCGLERMDQVMFAVLESDGAISIVPRRREGEGDAHAALAGDETRSRPGPDGARADDERRA